MANLLSRRGIIGGLASLIAAPAIVRPESLMQIRAPKFELPDMRFVGWDSRPYKIWRVLSVVNGQVEYFAVDPLKVGDGVSFNTAMRLSVGDFIQIT